MPGKSRNMSSHKAKGSTSEFKTKRRKRDIDQIFEEIKPENVDRTVKELTVYDEDRPGLGQFYCLTCARYFVSTDVLNQHTKSKDHKKRLKELKEKPWGVEDANIKVDTGIKKRKADDTMDA